VSGPSRQAESGPKQSLFKRFIENFGKVPEEKPPLIPQPYRVPFFWWLALVSLVLLALLVWLVIIPGIRAQQSSSSRDGSSASLHRPSHASVRVFDRTLPAV